MTQIRNGDSDDGDQVKRDTEMDVIMCWWCGESNDQIMEVNLPDLSNSEKSSPAHDHTRERIAVYTVGIPIYSTSYFRHLAQIGN